MVGLLCMIGFYILLVKIFTKKNPVFFMKGISPAQLLAFSTSSSAATLPVTMERVTEHLGVEEEIASFVLPIGATINMDGTSLYQAVAAVFIAQAFGMGFDFRHTIRNYSDSNFSIYRLCSCSWRRNGNASWSIRLCRDSGSRIGINFCY